MKKIARSLLLTMLFAMLVASVAYAAPKGFLEVKITPKNFSKYIGIKKKKIVDEFGDYEGYEYVFYSKLRKKGYYLYDYKNYAVKCTFTITYRMKTDNEDSSYTQNSTATSITDTLDSWGTDYIYKYGKISNFKVLKTKGKIIFVKPSNVKSVKAWKNNGKVSGYEIILKRRYNKHTLVGYTKKGKKYYYINAYATKKSEIP